MKYTFCTLFDRNYLFKGLALYDSLSRHCQDFNLWILCMDEAVYPILERMGLKNVRLIALKDFETEDLKKVRQERTVAEYCWTCTGPLIDYVMQQNESPLVAYVDADLFFFGDPRPIYDEMGDNSILIIEHRYAAQYIAWEKTSGIYNVSMVIFRNDAGGKECLESWIKQCLEACSLNPEAGQCGDQKYLDGWPTRFRNVKVLQHKGGGLAPWNISRYHLFKRKRDVFVDDDILIFYHFHALRITGLNLLGKRAFVASNGYFLTRQQKRLVYKPYALALKKAIDDVEKVFPRFTHGYQAFHAQGLSLTLLKGNLFVA